LDVIGFFSGIDSVCSTTATGATPLPGRVAAKDRLPPENEGRDQETGSAESGTSGSNPLSSSAESGELRSCDDASTLAGPASGSNQIDGGGLDKSFVDPFVGHSWLIACG
jgi:hypothetical protein